MNTSQNISQITEDIYLGNIHGASDEKLLNLIGITHIINLSCQPNFFPNKYKYLKIDIADSPNVDISKYFDLTNKFLDRAISENGKIFVHCMAGISRSPTIVISYLMLELNLMTAYKTVQSRRRIINPNEGFMRQLYKYEQYLSNYDAILPKY